MAVNARMMVLRASMDVSCVAGDKAASQKKLLLLVWECCWCKNVSGVKGLCSN